MHATPPPASALPSHFWRLGLLIFFAVVALGSPQAALLPLLDRDEPRFAEASREMLQSGNGIVPTFNHAPRYAKPPLIYWCQVVTFTLFGENACSARLPSLLATAGTACILFAWGAQLGGLPVGLGAALSYAFCLQAVQQGRVATADALLIFFMTLTAFAGWRLVLLGRRYDDGGIPPPSHERSQRLGMLTLALAIAGGFLAKGPEALLPLLPLLICARGTPRVIPRVLASLLGGLLLVLLWALPAYLETHGDYWRVGLDEGVGSRMVTGLQGHGSSNFGSYLLGVLLFYPLGFLIGALPIWPLVVVRRRKLFRRWKPDPLDTYLLLNVALIVLIFSLMVTKLPHYTLPAFPFLALILARRWDAVGLSSRALTDLASITGVLLALLTAFLVPLALAHNLTPSPVGELVRKAHDILTPQTQFALVDFREPNAIWEMRRVASRYGELIPESQVITYLRQPGPHAVVLTTALWQKIVSSAAQISPAWKAFEARGWNTAKGWDPARRSFATIDLTLVIKP